MAGVSGRPKVILQSFKKKPPAAEIPWIIQNSIKEEEEEEVVSFGMSFPRSNSSHTPPLIEGNASSSSHTINLKNLMHGSLSPSSTNSPGSNISALDLNLPKKLAMPQSNLLNIDPIQSTNEPDFDEGKVQLGQTQRCADDNQKATNMKDLLRDKLKNFADESNGSKTNVGSAGATKSTTQPLVMTTIIPSPKRNHVADKSQQSQIIYSAETKDVMITKLEDALLKFKDDKKNAQWTTTKQYQHIRKTTLPSLTIESMCFSNVDTKPFVYIQKSKSNTAGAATTSHLKSIPASNIISSSQTSTNKSISASSPGNICVKIKKKKKFIRDSLASSQEIDMKPLLEKNSSDPKRFVSRSSNLAMLPDDAVPYQWYYGYKVGELVWIVECIDDEDVMWPGIIRARKKIPMPKPEPIDEVRKGKAQLKRKMDESEVGNNICGSPRKISSSFSILIHASPEKKVLFGTPLAKAKAAAKAKERMEGSSASDSETYYAVSKPAKSEVNNYRETDSLMSIRNCLRKRFNPLQTERYEYLITAFPFKNIDDEANDCAAYRDAELMPFIYSKMRPSNNRKLVTAVLHAMSYASSWAVPPQSPGLIVDDHKVLIDKYRSGGEYIENGDIIRVVHQRRVHFFRVSSLLQTTNLTNVQVSISGDLIYPHSPPYYTRADRLISVPYKDLMWIVGPHKTIDARNVISRYYPRFHEMRGKMPVLEQVHWDGSAIYKERDVQIDWDQYDGRFKGE